MMTFAEATAAYLGYVKASCVDGTVNNVVIRLRLFSASLPANCQLRDVTTRQIAEYLRAMQRAGRRGSTIQQHLSCISALFTWCCNHRLIRRTPVDKFRLPKIVIVPATKHCILAEHHEKIISWLRCPRYHKPIRPYGFWILICELAYRTGLRVSDCCCLQWPSVDFDHRRLIVTPRKTKRLNKVVTIPMDDLLYQLLLDHRAKPYQEYGPSPLVLPEAEWFYHDSPAIMRLQFNAIMRRLHYEQFTFHSYRHGFVSRLVNSGVSPIVISSITGHCLEEIQTYAHVSLDAQRNALTQAGMPSALTLPEPTEPTNVIPMIAPEEPANSKGTTP